MTQLLGLLPWWVKALALAALVALAALAVRHYNEGLREEGREEIRAQWREAARLAQRAEDHSAAERRKKDKEAEDATAAALTRLADDVAGARAAAGRLQRRADQLEDAARRRAASCGAAGAAASGEPGEDPIGVLAHMLRRIDEAAGRVGEYADALRIAGEGCERRFDAVTDTQLHTPSPAPQVPSP